MFFVLKFNFRFSMFSLLCNGHNIDGWTLFWTEFLIKFNGNWIINQRFYKKLQIVSKQLVIVFNSWQPVLSIGSIRTVSHSMKYSNTVTVFIWLVNFWLTAYFLVFYCTDFNWKFLNINLIFWFFIELLELLEIP